MVGYISPLTAVSESLRTGNVREGEVRISATRRQRKERNARWRAREGMEEGRSLGQEGMVGEE